MMSTIYIILFLAILIVTIVMSDNKIKWGAINQILFLMLVVIIFLIMTYLKKNWCAIISVIFNLILCFWHFFQYYSMCLYDNYDE